MIYVGTKDELSAVEGRFIAMC